VKDALAVMLGGALGSLVRHWCTLWIVQRHGETFPWATITVNVTGCFVVGFVSAWLAPTGSLAVSPATRLFVVVGFLGGFTTFSAFSLQTLVLAQQGRWLAVGANVFGSVALCLLAVWIGHMAANAFSSMGRS